MMKKYLVVTDLEVVVQINGKLRAKLEVPVDLDDETLKKLALESENIVKHLQDLKILKVIVIKNKLVNIVAK